MYWPKPNSMCRSEAFRRFYWSLQATCRSCRPLLVTFQPKATTQSVLVTDNKCLPAEFNKERKDRLLLYTGIIFLQIAEQN